ncbi:MAG: rRNA pseudouridine synthase [Bacilli bacterium]|nr:rRNA pseudouridine synthase [Bacilli bacterium]MCI9434642.1 rRNA pseudouridine synthase [Bacilli bacterium]
MERLQKVIANSGYCSRRKAEELISSGKVKVNGIIIDCLGTCVDKNDTITILGKPLEVEKKEYILLNKPRGVITTTSDEKNRQTVLDLIETDKRLYPVGRLDYDTTGALLLTNDGELANLLMHPKNKIEKLYIVKVEGFVSKDILTKLSNGVYIDNFKTAKAKVRLKKFDKKSNTSLIEIIIHEGKNHQVKKMFEAVGYRVLKLKREKIAFLDVQNLKSGEYRYLSLKEVKKLYAEVKS